MLSSRVYPGYFHLRFSMRIGVCFLVMKNKDFLKEEIWK